MSLDDEIERAWDIGGYKWEKLGDKSGFEAGFRACYELYVKPAKKVIDLSVVTGSDIPMLFGDSMPRDWRRSGFLIEYRQSDRASYYDGYVAWRRCKFDTTRPVAWFGDSCPLPDGVLARTWWRDGTCYDFGPQRKAGDWAWKDSDRTFDCDIIAFQVTGLADGWVYPWEVSNE